MLVGIPSFAVSGGGCKKEGPKLTTSSQKKQGDRQEKKDSTPHSARRKEVEKRARPAPVGSNSREQQSNEEEGEMKEVTRLSYLVTEKKEGFSVPVSRVIRVFHFGKFRGEEGEERPALCRGGGKGGAVQVGTSEGAVLLRLHGKARNLFQRVKGKGGA